MKKFLCLLIALLLLLSACGKKTEAKPAAQSGNAAAAQETPAAQEDAAQEETPAQSGTPVKDEVAAKEPVHPYAWMGLSDMPECNYLDILSANHYYQVYDVYDSSGKTETAEAADGIDSCVITENSRSLALSGMFYYIDEDEKTVAQYDNTALVNDAWTYMESALAEGINVKGRAFNDTGRSTIPLYAAASDDTAEYEYYEYLTANDSGDEVTERFFMKDGDVFAIYTKTVADDSVTENTKVIKSITADVPAELFLTPDLSGYTETN